MNTKTNLLILVEQDLLPTSFDVISSDLEFWINQMYVNQSLNMSIQDYFILQHILKATRTSQLYDNYFLVHLDKLIYTTMDGVEFNNKSLGIHDLKARFYDSTKDEYKTSARPKIRETKVATYRSEYSRKHISRLKANDVLKFEVSNSIIDGVKNLAAQTNIGYFNKIAMLNCPTIPNTVQLKPKRTKYASAVELNLPELFQRDKADAYFDVFDKNFAPDEKTAMSIEVIEHIYPIIIDEKVYNIRKTSQRLASNEDIYSAQCLARDRIVLSQIQYFFFDMDVQRICSKDWEYEDWNNEYSITKNYLSQIMGYSNPGTNAYIAVDEAITRLCTVLHTLSVDPKDEYVMFAMGYVNQEGQVKHKAHFTYLKNLGLTYDVTDNPNTDLFNPTETETNKNHIYYLGWNDYDEQLYRKKLKFLDDRKRKMIEEWRARGNMNEPKPQLTESLVREVLEGFQISRYQEQSLAQIPNKHLDVAQSLISALVNQIRGAGYYFGVDYSRQLTTEHRKNMTKYLHEFVEERIYIEKYHGDYISSMLLPTLFEPCFYLGSQGLVVGEKNIKVKKLYVLLNDVMFVKVEAYMDSEKYTRVRYTLDAIVVTRDFAQRHLVPYISELQRFIPVSKRESRTKLSTIAQREDTLDFESLEKYFTQAYQESKKWREMGENIHGHYHPKDQSINQAIRYQNEPDADRVSEQTSQPVLNISEFESELATQLYFKLPNSDPAMFESWYENISNEELNAMLSDAVRNQPGFFDERTANYRFVGRTVLSGEFTRHE